MAWAYFLFWRQSLPLCSSSKTRPGFMQTNWSAPSQCSQVLGTFGFRCSFRFIGKMDGFPSSALKLLLPAYNPISLSISMAFLQSSWPFIVVDLFKDNWWLSDRIHWWSPNLWLHHTLLQGCVESPSLPPLFLYCISFLFSGRFSLTGSHLDHFLRGGRRCQCCGLFLLIHIA